jgi:glycosyltransferase involved in cell wall biosynthesis
LILKTNGATYSIIDREDCLSKINHIKSQFPSDWKLPNVYLLHGSLSDTEMNYLYNHPKIKSLVSLTHGEGFGRPLLEATMTGLPVMTTNWSGHLDFLHEEYSMLLGGEMVKVPKSQHWKDIIVPESQWFSVNEGQAYKCLNYCFENQQIIKSKSKQLMDINREKFTLNKMTEKLDEIMEKYMKDIPQQVGLQMPKLKKVGSVESPKIKLPKLKKVTNEATV